MSVFMIRKKESLGLVWGKKCAFGTGNVSKKIISESLVAFKENNIGCRCLARTQCSSIVKEKEKRCIVLSLSFGEVFLRIFFFVARFIIMGSNLNGLHSHFRSLIHTQEHIMIKLEKSTFL